MANDKNKVVENYCLEQLKQVYPNQTQIWCVRHKILKKLFTLKRIKSRGNSNSNESNKEPAVDPSTNQYERLLNQTNLLKRLNVQFAPKCYKMIKTSNNVYLVYQQFPSLTLQQHFSNQPLNTHQRNQLLENLAKAVMEVHNKQIVIIGLNLNNIYLKDKFQVFFGDWTLSKFIGSSEKVALTNSELNSQFIAKEIKQEGTFGVWSDIYSLGKIFKAIQNSSLIEAMNSTRKRLHILINKMTSANHKQRPSIKEVLTTLGTKVYQAQNTLTLTHAHSLRQYNQDNRFKANFKLKQTSTLNQQSMDFMDQSQLKSIKSVNMLLSQKNLEPEKSNLFQTNTSPKSATSKTILKSETLTTKQLTAELPSMKKNISQFREEHTVLSNNSVNRSCRNLNNERNWEGNQQVFKNVNKKRNLAFLLIDLAEFVLRTELNPELGFMLFKYSLLISKQNFQKWKSEKNSSVQYKVFYDILEKELAGVQQITNSLIEQMKEFAKSVAPLKREIDLSHLINDKYMKEKIVEFTKEIVLSCEKNQVQKLFSAKLIDILFKTYLILKKIEQGSYEKFWDKVVNEDYLYLSNQKYLKDQKSLGFRYLKSRIAQILSKK